jgi:outer membrane protein assembly factor BamA
MYDVYSKDPGDILKGLVTGSNGGLASGPGYALTWDSRDLVLTPTKGSFVNFSAFYYDKAFGSQYHFNNYSLDARKFIAIREKTTLAMQFYSEFNFGDPPFRMLALVGNNELMRGYYMGRYRDKDYIAGQIEYRFPVYRRFGMTVFGGGGQVAPRPDSFRIDAFHPDYGFGLRYLYSIENNINIRVDFGFGPHTNGQYITVGEAF